MIDIYTEDKNTNIRTNVNTVTTYHRMYTFMKTITRILQFKLITKICSIAKISNTVVTTQDQTYSLIPSKLILRQLNTDANMLTPPKIELTPAKCILKIASIPVFLIP